MFFQQILNASDCIMLHSKRLLIRPKLCGFYRLNTSNVHLIVLSQQIHYQTLPSLPVFLQQLPNEVFSNANMPLCSLLSHLCLASQCPEWFRGVFSFFAPYLFFQVYLLPPPTITLKFFPFLQRILALFYSCCHILKHPSST